MNFIKGTERFHVYASERQQLHGDVMLTLTGKSSVLVDGDRVTLFLDEQTLYDLARHLPSIAREYEESAICLQEAAREHYESLMESLETMKECE